MTNPGSLEEDLLKKKSPDARVLIFTATYNEAGNVSSLIEEIWEASPSADILVVDDNSKDGTGKLLEEIKKQKGERPPSNSTLGQLEVVHRPRKLGLGTAHKLAFQYAREKNYDILITMDADFSHNPSYIPDILKSLSSGKDFVIGSRFIEGGSCDYTGFRLCLSRSANLAARLLLGLKFHETTTSFRGFSKKLLTELDLDSIRQNGYSFFLETVYRISSVTENTYELPIHFEDRRLGETKISRKELRKGVFTLFRLGFARFFSSPSKPSASKEPKEKDFCNNCSCSYSVELYPASVDSHSSKQYNCTSFHHSSHGRIVRCLGCNFVYTSPQLSSNEIVELYSDVKDETYIANIEAREATFSYNFKKLSPFVPKKSKLLDIGAYCGVFLDVIRKQGYENVRGIEPSKWASSYARENYSLDVGCGTLDSFSAEEKFEVITAWDVLEHLSDPSGELTKIWNHLEDDGIFAFSTLDIHNWFPRLMGEKWPWYMDMHLYYFSDQVMKDILARNGFKVLSSSNYCHIITAKYFLEKLYSLGIPFAKTISQSSLSKKLENLHVPFRFGDIKLYVCQKQQQNEIPKESSSAKIVNQPR